MIETLWNKYQETDSFTKLFSGDTKRQKSLLATTENNSINNNNNNLATVRIS